MFGFVQICEKELSDEELARYRAFYCGICHTLGEEYRQIARLALSYYHKPYLSAAGTLPEGILLLRRYVRIHCQYH